MTIADEITNELRRMSEPQQLQVLDFARNVTRPAVVPAGVRLSEMRSLVGTFPAEDLRQIEQAIEEGCEQIDAESW